MKEIAHGQHGIVYDLGDGTVLKWQHPNKPPEAIQIEAEVSHLAYRVGIPTPQFIGLKNEPNEKWIRYQKLNGIQLSRLILEHPWKLIWAIKQMAQILVQTHSVKVQGVPLIKESFERRIQEVVELSEDQKKRSRDMLSTLEDGDRLCHYDYHPSNLMVEDDKCYVIDWGSAKCGSPMADIAHTYILNKVDGILEDVPWFNRLLIRVMRNLYIELFLYFYSRYSSELTYREIKSGIKPWIIPVATARLTNYGDFETSALLQILKRAGL